MNEILTRTINDLRSKKGLELYDEEATKQTIILRILDALGWDMYDVQDIMPEYSVDTTSAIKIDYALAQNSGNMVLIEAKRVGSNLENAQEQLINYSFRTSAEVAVLTDGIFWWFYLPRGEGSWGERKCFSIDLFQQDLDEIVRRFTQFLFKENVVSGKSVGYVRDAKEQAKRRNVVKENLPKAWNTMIDSEDEEFLDLFNRYIEKVSGYPAEAQVMAEFLSEMKNPKRFNENSAPENSESGNIPRANYGSQLDYTNKSPKSCAFGGKTYPIGSWKELLMRVCEEVYVQNQKDFSKVRSVKGRKRQYFAEGEEESKDLKIPQRIGKSSFFVETNFSANSIVNICNDVLYLFGDSKGVQVTV